MIRRRIRSFVIDEACLEGELFALCARLRQSQCDKLPSGGDHRRTDRDYASAAARACYMIMKHRSDADFSRLLEAERRTVMWLRTLQETASLLAHLDRCDHSSGWCGRGRLS